MSQDLTAGGQVVIRRTGDTAVIDAIEPTLRRVEAIKIWRERLVEEIGMMKETRVIVNLAGGEYLPGPILHTLSVLNQRAQELKKKFAVCEIGPNTMKAVRATRMNLVIPFLEKERDAIQRVHAKKKH